MKTSINIPSDLVARVKAYNAKHPDQPISFSGVSKQAIEKKLTEVEVSV